VYIYATLSRHARWALPGPESDSSVKLGEGDLMLCHRCDYERHRMWLEAQATAHSAQATASSSLATRFTSSTTQATAASSSTTQSGSSTMLADDDDNGECGAVISSSWWRTPSRALPY